MGAIFGYVRKCITPETIETQLKKLKENGVETIYCDRDIRTVELEKLMGTSEKSGILTEGDTLVVTSPVVLGDSFPQINQNWITLTHTLKVTVKALDMKSLPTKNNGAELDRRFFFMGF